jgi:hypothetical protein
MWCPFLLTLILVYCKPQVFEAWNVFNPNPDSLVWVKRVRLEHLTYHVGVLTVPLWHQHPRTAPSTFLEVMLLTPSGKTEFSAGALLSHCGGPGSNAHCGASAAYLKSQSANSSYYALGITQRGVPFSSLSALAAATEANEGRNPPWLQCSPGTLRPLPELISARFGTYKVEEVRRC